MEKIHYKCPKCGNTKYVSDQIQTAGGNFSKIGYTELYRRENNAAWDILDFLIGS